MDQLLAMPGWLWLLTGLGLHWMYTKFKNLKLTGWKKPKTVNERVKALFADEVRQNTKHGFDEKLYRREL